MRPSIVLACLAGAVSAQRSQAELDQLNKDATCVNSSFDKTFPGGSCTTDPACVCNQQQYRQDWFCMIAKRCRPEAFYDQIATIQRSCAEFGKTTSLDFDTQSLCGFKQPVATGTLLFYPMSSTSSAQPSPASSASGDKSKTAQSSNGAATTSSSQAAAETSGASGASASSPAKTTSGSQASGASSGAAPSKSADASAKTGSGSMLAVSNLAVVLAGVGLAL